MPLKADLIFATHNQNKLAELNQILSSSKLVITSLDEIGYEEEIEETGSSLEENALIKARTIQRRYHKNVISEDTGLEIMALGNRPGVNTARFAGPDKDSEKNMDLVLNLLKDSEHRKARFRTIVALIYNGEEYLLEGICNGTIASIKTGKGGFGYDPIFIPEGYNLSFAELDSGIKNKISHRGIALRRLEKKISYIKQGK